MPFVHIQYMFTKSTQMIANCVVHISEMSEDLLQYFVEPKVLQHEGGHFIPASAPQKKVYTEFLQDMLERKGQKS